MHIDVLSSHGMILQLTHPLPATYMGCCPAVACIACA